MTNVRLYKDIGLDPTFKRTIDFANVSEQNNWFASKDYKLVEDVNYNKLQNELVIPGITYSEALEYTYIVLDNVELEATSNNRYYCFIDSVELVAEDTVQFTIVLDPIQTFMFRFQLGQCMVSRQHLDRKYWDQYGPTNEIVYSEQHTYAYEKLPENDYVMVCVVFTSPNLKFKGTGWPDDAKIDYENTTFYGLFAVDKANPSKRLPIGVDYNFVESDGDYKIGSVSGYFPSLNDIITGQVFNDLCVASDGIISVSATEYYTLPIHDSGAFGNNRLNFEFEYHLDGREIKLNIKHMGYIPLDGDINKMINGDSNTIIQLLDYNIMEDIEEQSHYIDDYTAYIPEIPSDGDLINSRFEPALAYSPYTNRYIMTGAGKLVLQIPDAVTFYQSQAIIGIKTVFSSGGVSEYIYGSEINNFNIPSISGMNGISENMTNVLDVVSNAWKDYVLTRRDTDRQIISNQNWQRAIDNAIFMSYGGSLVASRGASGSSDSTEKRQKIIKHAIPISIGLALGSSVITSVVDAHYAWENQKAKEQQIRNTPSNVISEGSGIQSFLDGRADYYYVTTTLYSDEMDKLTDIFQKYGYNYNRYDKPNIRSRKYFNYLLTSGCTIEGNLPSNIKQAIATIFDNGITIFHADYCPDMEYPIYDNIERSLL